MVDVDDFLKESGSNWLRADDVKEGDKLEIIGPGRIDDETFDSSYLVLPIRILRTGEEKDARLGARNISRLKRSFGTSNTEEWVSRHAEVVSIEEYKKFGTKGFILRGLRKEPVQTQITAKPREEEGLSSEALDALRNNSDVIELGMPLNEGDWNLLPVKARVELVKKGLVEQREDGLYFFTEAAKKLLKR